MAALEKNNDKSSIYVNALLIANVVAILYFTLRYLWFLYPVNVPIFRVIDEIFAIPLVGLVLVSLIYSVVWLFKKSDKSQSKLAFILILSLISGYTGLN